jgi:hypothetical protein
LKKEDILNVNLMPDLSLISSLTEIYPEYRKEYQREFLGKDRTYYHTQSASYVNAILEYTSLDYNYNKDFDYHYNDKDLTEINSRIFNSKHLMYQNKCILDYCVEN